MEEPGCHSCGFLSCLLPGRSRNPSYPSSIQEERGCLAPKPGFSPSPSPLQSISRRWLASHQLLLMGPCAQNHAGTCLCARSLPQGSDSNGCPRWVKKIIKRKEERSSWFHWQGCSAATSPSAWTQCLGAPQSHPASQGGGVCLVLKRAAFGLTVKRCKADTPAARSIADCVYKSFLS